MYTKKYQAFVSSTYIDLKEERNELMLRLLLDGFIPAGMEQFGAIDEDQFEHIKRIIDVSDYYVVIVGNRYGATDDNGVSYTEKEYLYAKEKKIPVLALIHSEPGNLPAKHAEKPAAAKKLERFRKSLKTGRLVASWTDRGSLIQNALSSLHKEMTLFPSVGWVRGDQGPSVDVLSDLNSLRKENEALKVTNKDLEERVQTGPITNLADFDEEITVVGAGPSVYGESATWQVTTTWENVYTSLAPHLIPGAIDGQVLKLLSLRMSALAGQGDPEARIYDHCYQQIKVQFLALKLVQFTSTPGTYGPKLNWNLTERGHQVLQQLMTVRTKKTPDPK
jgi:hypothetical protein